MLNSPGLIPGMLCPPTLNHQSRVCGIPGMGQDLLTCWHLLSLVLMVLRAMAGSPKGKGASGNPGQLRGRAASEHCMGRGRGAHLCVHESWSLALLLLPEHPPQTSCHPGSTRLLPASGKLVPTRP